MAVHDNKQANNNNETDNSSLNKRVAYFSLRSGNWSVEDCLTIPQFQESKLLLTVALPSAAPGFRLMAQDVCLNSCHHFSILANKKEEQKGRMCHCLQRRQFLQFRQFPEVPPTFLLIPYWEELGHQAGQGCFKGSLGNERGGDHKTS